MRPRHLAVQWNSAPRRLDGTPLIILFSAQGRLTDRAAGWLVRTLLLPSVLVLGAISAMRCVILAIDITKCNEK
jgi:hypothetical protein